MPSSDIILLVIIAALGFVVGRVHSMTNVVLRVLIGLCCLVLFAICIDEPVVPAMTTTLDDPYEDIDDLELDPTAIKRTKHIPHAPHVKQHAFLWLTCREALFGGAAGGGKSDALLMAALQYVDVPGYAAVLFRRTFADLALPGAAMSRAQESAGAHRRAVGRQHRAWRFPSAAHSHFRVPPSTKGAVPVPIGGVPAHWVRRADPIPRGGLPLPILHSPTAQGPHWTAPRTTTDAEPIVRGLSAVPIRVRAATNPGGEGHRWVRRRFIDSRPDTDDARDVASARAAHVHPLHARGQPITGHGGVRGVATSTGPDNPGPAPPRRLVDPPAWHVGLRGGPHRRRTAVGRQFDKLRADGELGEPHGGTMGMGADYGDFATVMLPIWPLERGGVYVPIKEALSSRQDLEEIWTLAYLTMKEFPYWWSSLLYDASFAQSKPDAREDGRASHGDTQRDQAYGATELRPRRVRRYKTLRVKHLRLLLANSHKYMNGAPGTTRLLAISPRNTTLLDQMRDYQEDEFGSSIRVTTTPWTRS